MHGAITPATFGLAVDWRLYSQSHQLTDKQQKLADKIRRQEQKIHNLQTETDRIKVCLRMVLPDHLLPCALATCDH